MIPELVKGNLPEGIHKCTIKEIEERFTFSDRRKELFSGLKQAVNNLDKAGVERVYIDGSFVTSKQEPVDIDGCWDANSSINMDVLDQVFLNFDNNREAMKTNFGVDFFVSQTIENSSGVPFVEFFQTDRDGIKRGILLVEL
jgi:hypothetical protein